ncbi:MAG TPA: cell filamentation protein Fic [Flavobacteriaceae bacterium]|nr:cell filamentation protein Fic [Flavobacteriaceae bacterium]
MDTKSKIIVEFLRDNKPLSSTKIFKNVGLDVSYATIKRILKKLVEDNLITFNGEGKARKYSVSESYDIFYPLNLDTYFEKEIDDRNIKTSFNLSLIPKMLSNINLFTKTELDKLNNLLKEYKDNISQISENLYKKELERLAIDLSWKSAQIEGNTYSLLETERLLKDKETAQGKTKDDAIMLLNHKDALDFIIENPDYVEPLKVSSIEDIHSLLIKELGVEKNIRKRRVGISGTNYKPLDNEFQIREALQEMCILVNKKDNVFEKSLLVLVLISYIQAFNDGNKRTARILSNAILINNQYCPISFRTIDSVEYKKAMLVFYEQNNITIFKKIFINQFEFAVKTYF